MKNSDWTIESIDWIRSSGAYTIWTTRGVARLHYSTDSLLFSYISVHINIVIFVDQSMKKFFQKVRVNLRASWNLSLLFSYISVHINIVIFVDQSMKKFFQKVRVNLRASWNLRTGQISKETLYRWSWFNRITKPIQWNLRHTVAWDWQSPTNFAALLFLSSVESHADTSTGLLNQYFFS